MSEGMFGGMQVDIRTGLPLEKVESKRLREEEERLESDIAQGLAVEQQLNSPGGDFFMGVVNEALERRIDELVSSDPAATALLSLYTLIGGKIKIGEASAKRLAYTRMGKESRNL